MWGHSVKPCIVLALASGLPNLRVCSEPVVQGVLVHIGVEVVPHCELRPVVGQELLHLRRSSHHLLHMSRVVVGVRYGRHSLVHPVWQPLVLVKQLHIGNHVPTSAQRRSGACASAAMAAMVDLLYKKVSHPDRYLSGGLTFLSRFAATNPRPESDPQLY